MPLRASDLNKFYCFQRFLMTDPGTWGMPLCGGPHWCKSNRVFWILAAILLPKPVSNCMNSAQVMYMAGISHAWSALASLTFQLLPVASFHIFYHTSSVILLLFLLPPCHLSSLKVYVLCGSRLKNNTHSSALIMSYELHSLRSDGSIPVFQAPMSSSGTLSGSLHMALSLSPAFFLTRSSHPFEDVNSVFQFKGFVSIPSQHWTLNWHIQCDMLIRC